MPSFACAVGWSAVPPGLIGRIPAALGDVSRVWRDGAVVDVEPRIAVALPGPVFPVLGDLEALRARDPASFTAPEVSGATFTVWEVDVDWFTPPLLPRQSGGLGVGRAGATVVCDARAVSPAAAAAFLAALVPHAA
jgi:hypothetical protein